MMRHKLFLPQMMFIAIVIAVNIAVAFQFIVLHNVPNPNLAVFLVCILDIVAIASYLIYAGIKE